MDGTNGAPVAGAFPRLRSWNIAKPDDARLETLGRLLRLNHERFAALFAKHLLLHNHVPHVSASLCHLQFAANLMSIRSSVLRIIWA